MLHWQHLPIALREEDGVMIFSGSVVVDWHNTSGFCTATGADRSCLVAIYTGHGHGKQTQSLAYSNDRGRTWTKYAKNPVIDLGLKDFRDPKVFWHEPTQRWVMVAVLPDQHKVRLFASADLKDWTPLSDFGPAGATGGVWDVRISSSCRSRANPGHCGCSTSTSIPAESPEGPAASTSSARSTARASSPTSPPSGRGGRTTARLLRSPVVL